MALAAVALIARRHRHTIADVEQRDIDSMTWSRAGAMLEGSSSRGPFATLRLITRSDFVAARRGDRQAWRP